MRAQSSASGPAIAITTLAKRFGSVVALESVDLEIHPGEVVGLLGPNGAGKTTTIKILGGALEPDGGSVCVLGFHHPPDSAKIRPLVGVLTESAALYSRLTVEENLLFFGQLYAIPNDRLRPRIRWLRDLLGLGQVMDRRAGFLSTGERKRASLGRVLIHDPAVLLLDEPWTGLDPAAGRAVRECISAIAEHSEGSVLLCTHGLSEAAELCDRIAILARGRIRAVGTPASLAGSVGPVQYLIRTIEQGVAGDPPWACDLPGSLGTKVVPSGILISLAEERALEPVLRALAPSVTVLEARRVSPTLEDAYLRVVSEWS